MPTRLPPPHPPSRRMTWPQPLWLHLGSAWNCLSNAVNGWMSLSDGLAQPGAPDPASLYWTKNQLSPARNLFRQSAKAKHAPAEIASLIATDAAQQWQDTLTGLWLYQNHPAQRGGTDRWQTIATHHAVALKILPATHKRKNRSPVLIVPSLINRFHILDLAPQHSFAQFLRQAGHDVYLIDWHHDLTKKLPTSVENCITDYILRFARTLSGQPHLIGYCMGGTLSIAAACLEQSRFKSLSLIATPWDFHAPSRQAGEQFAHSLHKMIRQSGHNRVAAQWLQMLFWQRDPLAALRKFQRFAQLETHTPQADLFALAEDWLNDGVDLPASLLQDCAEHWFKANEPLKGSWSVAHQSIAIKHLKKIPIHIVNAQRDQLVPLASTPRIQQAHQSVFATGHIGLFAGALSMQQVWPQVQQFLAVHNT